MLCRSRPYLWYLKCPTVPRAQGAAFKEGDKEMAKTKKLAPAKKLEKKQTLDSMKGILANLK